MGLGPARRWGLTEEQWSTATRCPGWDVAALYAHHSVFPLAMSVPPPPVDGPVGEPFTAIEVLMRFNAPDGVAHSMAGTVADGAVSEATAYTRRELVDRFIVDGPTRAAVVAPSQGDRSRALARLWWSRHAGGSAADRAAGGARPCRRVH